MACAEWKKTYDICDDDIPDGIPIPPEVTDRLVDVEDLKPRKPLFFEDVDRKIMIDVVKMMLDTKPTNKKEMKNFLTSARRKFKINLSPMNMIYIYRFVCQEVDGYTLNTDYIEMMQSKTVRQNSGVMVVTLFTSPWPKTTDKEYGDGKLIKKEYNVKKIMSTNKFFGYTIPTFYFIFFVALGLIGLSTLLFYLSSFEENPLTKQTAVIMGFFGLFFSLVMVCVGFYFMKPYDYVYYVDKPTSGWTREFSCKYNCYYCPAFPDNPRSYDPKEPGNARAQRMEYNVTLQIWDRIHSYLKMGLSLGKFEVLVLGGTWESYPKDYREKFIRLIYYAFNTFLDPERESNPRPVGTLEEEMRINETSPCNVIGLTLETRPDCIGEVQVRDFRRWGVTRIQIGIQHFHDEVLERVNRGTNFKQACYAIKLLLDSCFKVDIHLMLDLIRPLKPEFIAKMKKAIRERVNKLDIDDPDYLEKKEAIIYEEEDKATPDDYDEIKMIDRDRDMLTRFCFPKDEVQPYGDQVKLYPYAVTDNSRGKEIWKKGRHESYVEEVTYSDKDVVEFFKKKSIEKVTKKELKKYHDLHNPLYNLLLEFYAKIPYYVRCNRLPRDIPSSSILAGNKDTNMRQYFNDHFKKHDIPIREIRYSEVRDKSIDPKTAEPHIFHYRNNGGEDYCIQFRTPDLKYLFGFLRLRFPDAEKNRGVKVFSELKGCGLVRELHVYGAVKVVGASGTKAQHLGFGTRLLAIAETIAKAKSINKLAVISGNGVKVYYRKRGYEDIGSFLIKTIETAPLEETEPKIIYHHLTFPEYGKEVDTVEIVTKDVKDISVLLSKESKKKEEKTLKSIKSVIDIEFDDWEVDPSKLS